MIHLFLYLFCICWFVFYALTRFLPVLSRTKLCISFKNPADTALACVENVPFAPSNYDDFPPKIMLPMRVTRLFVAF